MPVSVIFSAGKSTKKYKFRVVFSKDKKKKKKTKTKKTKKQKRR
jgi:hypothetical protein